MAKNVLIIGATSAIAEAAARLHAARGDNLFLLARNAQRLAAITEDLRIRGSGSVQRLTFEAEDLNAHKALVDDVFEAMGTIDVALIAHGTLPDQKLCEQDFDVALKEIDTNATGSLSLLTHLANRFEAQGHGTIAVITSVAGDRGRQSNYVYGASKAMVSVFLQGLRNRLHRSQVDVVDIRPGFVDTPMTEAFDKNALWAEPDQVARGIVKAIDKGRAVVYLPWYWRPVMQVIRLIPEGVFKRLRL